MSDSDAILKKLESIEKIIDIIIEDRVQYLIDVHDHNSNFDINLKKLIELLEHRLEV